MKRISLAVTVLVCALSLSALGANPKQPQKNIKPKPFLLIKNMPDICQIDSRLPNRGKEYCGPAAVSNAIVWLAMNGHKELIPSCRNITDDKNIDMAQIDVIKTLGSAEYMKTALYAGTDPIDVIYGLDRYIRSCGYEPVIEWKGYREGGKFTRGPIPELNWMNEGFDKEYNLVLEIGWYNYSAHCKSFIRNGGHYVTVTAIDLSGKTPKMIVHNPSIGGGTNPKPQVCTLRQISSGTLAAWSNYDDRPASGYFIIEGLTMPYNAKTAIVEGVIKFSVRCPKNESAQGPAEKPVIGLTGF
jgi:hypothetical protein